MKGQTHLGPGMLGAGGGGHNVQLVAPVECQCRDVRRALFRAVSMKPTSRSLVIGEPFHQVTID